MTRINLTDESNRWFDPEKAERYDEGSYWNGNNHISLVTGDQFLHECIYITASGKIIKNNYSQYQGSRPSYEEIEEQEALEWFQRSEYTDDMVPECLREKYVAYLKEMEI